MLAAWAIALYFPAIQIAPLYLWHNQARSETVLQRVGATAIAGGALGWLPTAHRLAANGGGGKQAVLEALGLRTPGLAAACTLPLALTALLFAGPLVTQAGSPYGGVWQQRGAPLSWPVRLRNWLAAPLLEELLFRACLISYLLAAGVGPSACIWLSPLLFASSHLHHLHDMTRFQGLTLRDALRALAFQLSYTTVFGWLAACFFVRSRHLAAAVLPHAFCNFVGPPALPLPGCKQRRRAMVAYAGGLLGFFCLLRPLTDPGLYANS